MDLRRVQPRPAHRWRARVDAVAVGIGTALADDPQLTARIEGVHHQPRRVVFDSTARLPLDSQLVAAAPELPLIVVVSRAAPRAATEALEMAGAEVVVATGENEPARVRSALDQLGALDPPVTADPARGRPAPGRRVPRRRRDRRGAPVPRAAAARRPRRPRPARGEGVERIADALRALTLDCERVADDLLVSARLREW